MTGILHSIESLAAVDGTGVRCSFFLSGCPLRCVYCHNPDTWERSGREVTEAELVKKAKRYKPYYGEDGGVTFSGGEPLLQASFIRTVVPGLQKENIPYILDTSGQVELCEDVRFVYENCQSVILDLKFWDDASYRKYTGCGIEKTLKTLDFLEEIEKPTLVRTVIVPGINDTCEHVRAYQDIISSYSCVTDYELLPFHTMGFFKYEKLGLENPLKDTKALDPKKLDELKQCLYEKNLER